jgi:hypothetical protein
MYSQNELEQIWTSLIRGEYANRLAHVPEKITDDGSEQAMSIPGTEGTSRLAFSRKSQDDEWSEIPYITEADDFGGISHSPLELAVLFRDNKPMRTEQIAHLYKLGYLEDGSNGNPALTQTALHELENPAHYYGLPRA